MAGDREALVLSLRLLSHYFYLLPPLTFCGGTLAIDKAASRQGTSHFTKLSMLLVP